MLDVGVRIFCDGCGSAGDCASCRMVGAIPGAKWVQCAEIVHMYRSTPARWRRVGGRRASRLAGDLRRNKGELARLGNRRQSIDIGREQDNTHLETDRTRRVLQQILLARSWVATTISGMWPRQRRSLIRRGKGRT